MRYCGNCGVPLYKGAIEVGHCLSCGAAITDTVSAAEAGNVAANYQHNSGAPFGTVPVPGPNSSLGNRLTDPDATIGQPPPKQPRRGRLALIFGAILAALLIFFLIWWRTTDNGTPPMAVSHTPTPTLAVTPGGTGTTPGAGSTPIPGGSGHATPVPGSTPAPGQGTPTPSTTPGARPTATPIPGGGQPSITVSKTTFSPLVCLGSSITFDISNSGGGLLNFRLTTDNALYQINPSSGSLSSGQSESVTVTLGATSGHIYVNAQGAANSQTITVHCAV